MKVLIKNSPYSNVRPREGGTIVKEKFRGSAHWLLKVLFKDGRWHWFRPNEIMRVQR